MPSDRASFRVTHPLRRVTLGDARWEYVAGGRGPRGLLVLGGALSFADCAHQLVAKFEGTRRVLAPTLPFVPDVGAIVDGLPRLLDLEGLGAVDVIGDGLGAGLAHVLARRHPSRVNRLALSGFGLLGPLRARAQRARLELLQLLPHTAVRAHCLQPFERIAEQCDKSRALEVLKLANEALDRHSRESLLHRLHLSCDLFRNSERYRVNEACSAKTLLMLANDDPQFTRQERDTLERMYAAPIVVRYLNAGRSFSLSSTWDLEKRLDLFLRAEPPPYQPRPLAVRARPVLEET